MVSFASRQKYKALWGLTFLDRFDAPVLFLIDYAATWYPEGDVNEVFLVFSRKNSAA
jgi:hypothetical protein